MNVPKKVHKKKCRPYGRRHCRIYASHSYHTIFEQSLRTIIVAIRYIATISSIVLKRV